MWSASGLSYNALIGQTREGNSGQLFCQKQPHRTHLSAGLRLNWAYTWLSVTIALRHQLGHLSSRETLSVLLLCQQLSKNRYAPFLLCKLSKTRYVSIILLRLSRSLIVRTLRAPSEMPLSAECSPDCWRASGTPLFFSPTVTFLRGWLTGGKSATGELV